MRRIQHSTVTLMTSEASIHRAVLTFLAFVCKGPASGRPFVVSFLTALLLAAAGCDVVGGTDDWSPAERESVAEFISGLEALQDGMSVLNSAPPDDLSDEARERALEHLRRARQRTASARDSVLAKIHPELPVRVRARLLKGLDDRIFGLEDGRPSRFFWGTSRLNDWVEWYNRTRNSWNLPGR